MNFQRLLNRVPCYQCIVSNRAFNLNSFNTFNSLYKNRLDKFKCFSKRNFNEQSIFNLNTNVPKDVVLYQSSSDKTFKIISVFSIIQFGFWLTVADSYNVLLNKIPKDDTHALQWMEKLKSKGKIITLGIPIACLCMGTTLIAICVVYTMKSVKILVLCKGGEHLRITSYGFLNRNITTSLPLESVSCTVGRTARGRHIPLKVKGKWFHYTLDKNGEICYPKLFDLTAGLRRNF